MLAKRIIPCLDVKDGRVVKGVNFVGLRDAGDPIECGLRYSDEGADELVFLDITASSDRRNIVADMVQRVADAINIPFTVGGGLRTLDDIQSILRAGADKISLNTQAVENPNLVRDSAERFGSQCIVVAIDARREGQPQSNTAKVYTHGGRNRTELDAVEWAQNVAELGAGEILLTSMDSDGTKKGYDLDLTRQVAAAVQNSCHRFRWSRKPGASPPGPERRMRKCGAGSLHLSFSRTHDSAGEKLSERARSTCPMSNPTKDILAKAQFNSDGLIPAVVQDARTREVLTVAYMNEEALRLTLEKGETYFYSRSRKALWHKGETSGNFQKVQRVAPGL